MPACAVRSRVQAMVSVIVPTHNCESFIKNCIDSLLSQDYPRLEILVVDDGSTDRTIEFVRYFSTRNPNVKLFTQEHESPAAARNVGVSNSNGEIIFFTDGDCIAPRNWVRSLMRYFDDEKIGAVGGAIKPASLTTIWEVFEQQRRENLYGKKPGLVEFLPTCNLAIRKSILTKMGGFDETYRYPSFEDFDLCYRIRRLGYKIMYDPAIPVYMHHEKTLRHVLNKALMHGRESVKLKLKMGYPLFKESLQNISWLRSLFMPTSLLKIFGKRLFPVAYLYEFAKFCGKIQGVIIYRF